MKPQVPDILSQFYNRHDPAVYLHEIKTDDLPEVGARYRDNTSGIVWQVIACSGEDLYEANCPDVYGYCDRPSSLVVPQRERLVILEASEGVIMHVTPETLNSQVSASEHYCLVSKTKATMKRFEELNDDEVRAPFWARGVKTLTTEKVLSKLADEGTTSLHVLNVYSTPHGLAELLIEYLDTTSVNRSPQVAKIKATWLPQDLLESAPKEALLKSQTFRRMLDTGMVVVITKGSAKRIENTPEYQEEITRLAERDSQLKPYHARYGMF